MSCPGCNVNHFGSQIQNGGFFWDNCSDNNEKFLNAYKQRKLDTVVYMLENNMVPDLMTTDANQNTIMHLLVQDYNGSTIHQRILVILLSCPDHRKQLLNAVNSNGDTPLHIAVRDGKSELAELLLKYGANQNIKNNAGEFVDTDDEVDVSVVPNVPAMLKALIQARKEPRRDPTDTETFSPVRRNAGTESSEDTEQFLGRLATSYLDPKSNMKGGAKVTGQRKLKKRSSVKRASAKRKVSLSRLIENEATEIHTRVVAKIAKEMKISEDEAKIIKAAFWKEIKEKFATLSNLDKSIELEKMATKKNMKAVDVEKTKEEMQKKREEKQKQFPREKFQKNKKPNNTETSLPNSETSE